MRIFFINILLLFILFPNIASASENLTPLNEKLYYEAQWSNINFGKIGIEIDQQVDKANVICDITSSGIMALFVKHSSHTTLTATGKNFNYPERVYESNYHTRKKARAVKLTYKGGKIAEEELNPPENREKRPAVPQDDINGAYDLMSFLLQMRSEITKAQRTGKTDFTLNAYDGRRLSQADFNIVGEKAITIAGEKQSALAVTARRKQLAGFTESEIADNDPNEPSLTIYFSNDKKLIPLMMEVPFFGQKISAVLIKKCDKAGECLLGISG